MEPRRMLDALIGAGASLLGGLINKSSSDASNKQQMALAQQNIALQREFAQNGIQWKAADAAKAGIHPLYALGANTVSFSPVSVGSTADTSMGNAVASAGQDISRAMAASSSEKTRATAALTALQLERGALENELLRSQIARMKGQIGPGMPIPGQTNSVIPGQGNSQLTSANAMPGVEVQPSKITVEAPGTPHQEAGVLPDVGYARTPTGYAPIPSKDVKERVEDQFIPETMWALRNLITPNLGPGYARPPVGVPLKYGHHWEWSRSRQEWQQVPSDLDPGWKGRKLYGNRWFGIYKQ